jgi:putative transcriptional regulator
LYRRDRQGQVLYATDAAAETDLARAVILVLRYDKDDGALGVILNRPGTEPADPLMLTGKGALSAPAVVFTGGPVRHEGYVLLVLLRGEATVPVRFRPVVGLLGTVPLSATPPEESMALARLFRGYVGWGPGELEADLAGEVLVPTGAPVDVAFTDTPAKLWRRLRATG